MVDAWSPDRRRNERREVPFPLYAHLRDGTSAQPAASRAVRVSGLSVGGLVIESSALLPLGHHVSLTLETPDGEIGPLTGRVVHSRLVFPPHDAVASSYVAGVAFDVLSADVIAAIEALLFSIGQHSAPGGARQAP
jgi:hypothetical protein